MIDQNKTKPFALFMALSLALILILAACSGQQTGSTTANTTGSTASNTSGSTGSTSAQNSTGSTGNTSAQDAGTAAVSYSKDVAPIFDSRCANCHGGNRTESGFVIINYADLMAGGRHGAAIVPGDAGNSLLVELVSSGEMPKRGPSLTPVEIQTISDWINQGALDN